MSRTTQLQQLIKKESIRQWTDEDIMNLPAKLRRELSTYAEKDGKPIIPVSPALQKMIKQKGFSAADGRAAVTMLSVKTINPMLQSNADWVLSKGGHEAFTPDTNTLYVYNGDKVVRPLTPIPSNPSNPDKYQNLDAVTAFVGTMVSHKNGVWGTASEQGWVKVFPSLSAAGVNAVASLVAEILNTDKTWESMTSTVRASVTGRNAAVFIRDALNNLPAAAYRYLNTKIVIDCLQALRKSSDGGYEFNTDEEGQDLVPARVYETVGATKDDLAFSSEYPFVLLYLGGWTPKARLPKVDYSNTVSLLAAKQKLVDVARGDSAIPALIAKSQGFSGMTTDTAKMYYFIISATLECWRRGLPADIRLTRDGDITSLYCALTYWRDNIGTIKGFPPVNIKGHWFKFLTAKRNANLNVAVEVKEHIAFSHTPGAVAVAYIDDSLKTKVDKQAESVNHDSESYSVLPKDIAEQYIVKCPIYGLSFFPQDEALKRARHKGTEQDKVPSRYENVQVYGHGCASDFFGIASTLNDLALVGVARTSQNLVYEAIPLTHYSTREKWYTKVHTDINSTYQAVFSPKKTYSPITNLLVISKGKISILVSLEGDTKPFVGKVLARGEIKRRVFEFPKPEVGAQDPTPTPVRKPFSPPPPVIDTSEAPTTTKALLRPKTRTAPVHADTSPKDLSDEEGVDGAYDEVDTEGDPDDDDEDEDEEEEGDDEDDQAENADPLVDIN